MSGRKRRKHVRRRRMPFLHKLLLSLVFTGVVYLAIAIGNTGLGQKEEQQDADLAVWSASENLEVHFLDVGQGDATLILCDGKAMLIDAGDNSKGSTVWAYLLKQGVGTLDYVICTHPDADHIGGMDVILTKFDCKTILMTDDAKDTRTYEDVLDAMKYKGYIRTEPVVGKTYSLGAAEFTIIAPNRTDYEETNDGSIGILLQNGDTRFLFAGDAEETAEQDMMLNGLDLAADVYKVSHHGSKTASSEAFLKGVSPQYAVISCGEGNDYGHPHAAPLNIFRKMGINVFRTDEQGTIVCVSNGKTLTWNCSPSDTWKTGN